MNDLEFHPVTVDRWDDLAAFFAGHGNPNYCWCMRWRLRSKDFNQLNSGQRRNKLESLVQVNTPIGVLGYQQGKPVGWCSVAPRETYALLERSRTLKRIDDLPVWSVVCFFVDPGLRGQGLPVKLLGAAVTYAVSQGARIIEGYPVEPDQSYRFMGSPAVFEQDGINTAPDWNIGGQRHQKALSTRLDAASGAITRTSSVWVSHSFDQRLIYDGEGIIEHHLGDAYPRYIVFARDHISYPLFHIKGDLGENNTRTRLGNIALIENDPDYKYIALFATENSSDTGSTISGPRNLAIVRVRGDDNNLDPSLPDTLTVTSESTQYTNRLRWLTHYSASSNLHAERPKLVAIGADQYIVLWEQWLNAGGYPDTFNGVYGMVIDDSGNVLRTATKITAEHHLHRGDDAFPLDNRAAWMTGNAVEHKLYIHLVDASLNYEMVILD
jgi:GNAT superfamily N-acetyltransferase